MRLAHGSQLATTAAYATYLFHDARILQPTKRWCSSPTKKAGRTRPALPIEAFSRLLAAEREQVQQRQQRGERRRDVREGGRREYPLRPIRLSAREDAVAGQEPVGTGGGVDLHRQRHNVERENPGESDDGELDEELARRLLDGVTDLVGRHANTRDGVAPEVALR